MATQPHAYRPEQLLSQFRTTSINEFHDWLGRTVMYSIYYISLISILFGILNLLKQYHMDLRYIYSFVPMKTVWLLVVGGLSIPALLPFATSSHWHMGFKSRLLPYFISVLFFFLYLYKSLTRQAPIIPVIKVFWIVVFVFFLGFILKRIHVRRHHRPDFIAIVFTIILTMGLYFGGAAFIYWDFIRDTLSNLQILEDARRFSTILACVALAAMSVIPTLQVWERILLIRKQKGADRSINWKAYRASVFLYSFGLLIVIPVFIITKSQLFHGVLSLAILFISGDPGLFFSRQLAHLRNLLKRVYPGRHVGRLSIDPQATNKVKILTNQIQKFFVQNIQNGSIMLILALGGFILPYLAYKNGLATELTPLVANAITVSIALSMIFLTFWFVNNRKKHIVLPFVVTSDTHDQRVATVAGLITHTFVEQLRHISLLLSMRQIEIIASRNDTNLPVFVTSGQEQELLEQVRSLGDIELASQKFSIGTVLAYLGNSLAHTKVRGTISPQKDNSIVVGVEFAQRGGQVISVDFAFVPETTSADLEKPHLDEIARKLAVKLVTKLGRHYHLATSWESLLNFVNGLDAAYHRNWWKANSFYKRTIAFEEASGGSPGAAYYNLGASMIMQGEISKGYELLKIAEGNGTPKAETQYMMALTLFNQHRDSLQFDRVTFDDIREKCRGALRSRPNFPEAHHLLATAYYQRGKLLERAYTCQPVLDEQEYKKFEIWPQDYGDDYKQAANHFKFALHGYERAISGVTADPVAALTEFDERVRFIQLRISATHRLADALRSLERFSEADTYYKETLDVLPTNIRTIVDCAKTFCHSRNWQLADQFIRSDIFNTIENRDNKSACFYMGWTLAGGIADANTPSSKIGYWFIHQYEKASLFRRTDQIKIRANQTPQDGNRPNRLNPNSQRALLSKSMLFLDFAFHQYPRYLQCWKQTDWHTDFEAAVEKLGSGRRQYDESFRKSCYEHFIARKDGAANPYFTDQLYLWLCWRFLALMPTSDLRIDHFACRALGWTTPPDKDADPYLHMTYPHSKGGTIFRAMVHFRGEMLKLQLESSRKGVNCNPHLRQKKVILYASILDAWKEALKQVKTSIIDKCPPTQDISFGERWTIDLFAELSILAARALTELETFSTVEYITEQSNEVLVGWLEHWDHLMPADFFFSPKVFDYQRASLYSWQSYSMLKNLEKVDGLNPAEAETVDRTSVYAPAEFEKIRTTLKMARGLMPNNPLAIYVEALVKKYHGQLEEATNDLNRLLSHVSPFNPHTYEKRNKIINSSEFYAPDQSEADGTTDPNSSGQLIEATHVKLAYAEQLTGQLQFFDVMSSSQVHLQLGRISQQLGDFKTVINHLIRAFVETPYRDERAEILMEVIAAYKREGLYADALAALTEADVMRNAIPENLPVTRSTEIAVLDCILKTAMEKYRDSIEQSSELDSYWSGNRFLSQQTLFLNQFNGLKAKSVDVQKAFQVYRQKVLPRFNDLDRIAREKPMRNGRTRTLNSILAVLEKYPPEIALEERKPVDPAQDPQWVELNDLGLELARQVLQGLKEDCVNYLVQYSEWLNNRAFNFIELGVDQKEARRYSRTACMIMKAVADLFPRNPPPRRIRETFAQCIDTSGWLAFANGEPEHLKQAQNLLESALKQNQESSIIYYHLARIHLTQVEQIWQSGRIRSGEYLKLDKKQTEDINRYLRAAFRTWRHAQRLDKNHSLYSRLRMVRQRIDTYRRNWESVMYPLAKKELEELDTAKKKTYYYS